MNWCWIFQFFNCCKTRMKDIPDIDISDGTSECDDINCEWCLSTKEMMG